MNNLICNETLSQYWIINIIWKTRKGVISRFDYFLFLFNFAVYIDRTLST